MELNGIRSADALSAVREVGSRPEGADGSDRGDKTRVERPSEQPTAGGVRGASSNASPNADSSLIRERSSEDRPGDAHEAAATKPAALPVAARLQIEVDPETNETRFRLRDRETGDVLREIPERELRELIRRGVYAQGDLLDRTF